MPVEPNSVTDVHDGLRATGYGLSLEDELKSLRVVRRDDQGT